MILAYSQEGTGLYSKCPWQKKTNKSRILTKRKKDRRKINSERQRQKDIEKERDRETQRKRETKTDKERDRDGYTSQQRLA